NLAWSYTTAPETLRDINESLRLAEKAVQLEPKNPKYRDTLGAAQYRAGHYRQAVETLLPNLQTSDDRALARNLYFLAMSHQQLGETAMARTYFEWAARWSRIHKDLYSTHADELRMFHAEAEALFKPK